MSTDRHLESNRIAIRELPYAFAYALTAFLVMYQKFKMKILNRYCSPLTKCTTNLNEQESLARLTCVMQLTWV